MSDGMTPDSPIGETGLRILSKSGVEIDYRSERDLISKIWEASIYTEGQPDCAVAVLLSIDDDEGHRVATEASGTSTHEPELCAELIDCVCARARAVVSEIGQSSGERGRGIL